MFYRLHTLTMPLLPTGLTLSNFLFVDPSSPSFTASARELSEDKLSSRFGSERLGRTGLAELGLFSGSEDGLGARYTRFTDPSIDYAYRSGNYFGRWDGFATSSMLVSALEITRKIRKAPWFLNPDYLKGYNKSFSFFKERFMVDRELPKMYYDPDKKYSDFWVLFHMQPQDSITHPYFIFKQNSGFIRERWALLNVVRQKHYRMFCSTTVQTRILANWRQLKFTREA